MTASWDILEHVGADSEQTGEDSEQARTTVAACLLWADKS